MQGNIVTAARWVFAGMVLSTTLLVAGIFFTVHGEKLFWAETQRPSCVPEAAVPPTTPSF